MRENTGAETAAMIAIAGGIATFVWEFASQQADVQALVAAAVARFGRLDCAVNNAVRAPDTHKIAEADLAEVDRVFEVDLRGVLLCAKYEIAGMLDLGGSVWSISAR